jgi:restriction endonuclease
MKLQFNSNLTYQQDAINAVINLFEGLPKNTNNNGFNIFQQTE